MNWLDGIFIIILIYIVARGLRLGLMLSIFNMIQLILSIIITKSYYPLVSGFIIDNPKIYGVFETISEFLLKLLFHSKIKEEVDFIPQLFASGMLRLIITIFSLILVFCLSNLLITYVLKIFSFLLKAPILKQLNKVGGLALGLVEGLLIVYLLSLILLPLASIMPYSFVGKGVQNSLILGYLKDMDIDPRSLYKL